VQFDGGGSIMTTAPPGRAVLMRYQVSVGDERDEMTAAEARAAWDETPDEQRTGDREGAFILWDIDYLGRLRLPVIFRPIRPTV
jgi:hypothetical protein